MLLTVQIELPSEVEEAFRARGENLAEEMKAAYAVDLFRRGQLSHYALSKALGLDRFQTDAYLKQHGIFEGSLTPQDVDGDLQRLHEFFGKDAQ
jgi:predicted HTH domain antitoxin